MRLRAVCLIAVFSIAYNLTARPSDTPATSAGAQAQPLAEKPATASRPDASINSIWNGGTGNWNLNTNWTPSGFPNNGGGNTYNVTIATGNDNVTLNTNVTISSLTLGLSSGTSVLQNLSGAAQTLNDLGALTINSGGQLNFGNASSLTAGGGVTNAGTLNLDQSSIASVTGNFTNSGTFQTNARTNGGGTNKLTVSGTFTNNPGANVFLGSNNDTTDVMNVGTLVNNGSVQIGGGATLNLTNQANGITDVVQNSDFDVYGSFKAGTANAFSKLGSVEGSLFIENGQTMTATPGGGTLTVSNTGDFDLDRSSTVTVSGSLTNSGLVQTNARTNQAGTNTLTITGAFTNNAGANVYLGINDDTSDVMNVATLANNGAIRIGEGATLNLTNQANGITDVVQGSDFDVFGSFKAGAANALGKLGSVEGSLYIENGQTMTDTPGGGTLTVSNTGTFDLDRSSTVTVSGKMTNSGTVESNSRTNQRGTNTLTVTGAFTNNAGANVSLGSNDDTTDVMNVATLANNGTIRIGEGATLNLTNQANGITDVIQNSDFDVFGSFKAGAANALGKLGSVEGSLYIENGQTMTDTPGGGTLTVSNTGTFDLDRSSTVTVSGKMTNSGTVESNSRTNQRGTNTLTVTGAFTNNAGANVSLGSNDDTTDVMNVATLANNGTIRIGEGATLNLTNQANGITDVIQNSDFDVFGSFKAGAANALGKLGSVEGSLYIENGQTMTDTPGGGTLTVSNTGTFDLDRSSTVTVSGKMTNSGTVESNSRTNQRGTNTLTVTGAFTNNAGANVSLGSNDDTTDVMNVATLANNGTIRIGEGATLNLTNQANGITDVIQNSDFDVFGSFKAGAANALGKLGSVEGSLYIENGQSTTDTPASGTLTVSNTGTFDLDRSSTVTISGKMTNSGTVETNSRTNQRGTNTLTVTGAFTNTAGANLFVGTNNDTTDVMNFGTLANSGTVTVGQGTLLNLTSSGTNTNTSAINIDSATMKISGATVTMAGAGTITMGTPPGGPSSSIVGASPSVSFTNANTIQGFGTISNMGIVNTGTIAANQSAPLLILPSSAGLNNQGTLSVLTGDTMQIGTAAGGALTNFATNTLTGGTYTVGGTLQFGAPGTNVVTDAANISLTGAGAQIIDFGGTSVLKNLATITSAGSLTLGTSWGSFTTAGNFTNNGTLSVGAGDKFTVNLADNLTNFSGTTLTGGTYKITGTFQFKGANIVTNAANITLSGANSKINGTGTTNGLANFAVNAAGASFALGTGRSFTTAGNFTNNGLLTVGAGDTFDVNGNLTNFSGSTLTGGAYAVNGTLQFNGANIVANAANITLAGSTGKIVNQSGVNALLGFTTNMAAGKFTLSNGNLVTTGGSFTNAGLFTVSAGSAFTVGGSSFNFTQTAGTTTVDGTLAGQGSGSLNLNGGSLFGIGTLSYAVVDGATLSAGDSATKTGELAINGTYAQNSAGAMDVTIGGKTAGTQYDQVNVSSSASLNGKLNITLASGFTPTVGSTFDILNASTVSGTFTTVTGLSINASEHFTVTYNGNDVVLTVVSGAAPTNSVSLSHIAKPGMAQGHYGRTVHVGLAHLPVVAPAVQPAMMQTLLTGRAFHGRDDLPAPAVQSASSSAGMASAGTFSAPAVNPMAAMNHLHFECGVSLNALRHTTGKQLLKSLWASPDSKNALNIGYMAMTPTR